MQHPERRLDAAEHAQAWRDLAREIAARQGTANAQYAAASPAQCGELIVIGSGIEAVGFALGDEELLRSADSVFFCVADPATIVWIKRLRPDAYDLYVLYDDSKPRYVTYIQMAEAMLHHVRQGRRVVCVFYGHPGVFVLATHRAILIARREGHRAVMRPAVCALDCLCADLGVDPCHPGMQMHEATDMLIRGRRPDTSLHVVLWQVGLIGEMGFRREGYINRNFSTLIEYLQQAYGPDYPVTHYVASRYPTIPPLAETYRLSELHDPAIQIRITGLSTFYLAPRDAARVDSGMAERLGLLKAGQTARLPPSALREIGGYGRREMKAFDDFARFEVPRDYQWQADTAASDFLIHLRQDTALQGIYAADPGQALQDPRFTRRLTSEERRLLATRDTGAIQVAAKGIHRRDRSNHALIAALLVDRKGCVRLLRLRRTDTGTNLWTWLRDYAAKRTLDLAEERLQMDLAQVRRRNLLPWTGVYAAEQPRLSITILGHTRGPGGLFYVNDHRIPVFTYRHGALEWRMANDNPTNGLLRFEFGSRGRRVIGHIWTGERPQPDRDYLEAAEVDPDRAHLAQRTGRFLRGEDAPSLNGSYALRLREGRRMRRVAFELMDDQARLGEVALCADRRAAGRISFLDELGDLAEGRLRFLCNPLTGAPEFLGQMRLRTGQQLLCFGVRLDWKAPDEPPSTVLPPWLARQLTAICNPPGEEGPPFLWQAWEKHHLTSRIVHSLGAWTQLRERPE